MNTLIPFKSRSEAIRLSRTLTVNHVAHTVINTPRNLGVSCGLSLLIYESSLQKVQILIKSLGLSTMQGVFKR